MYNTSQGARGIPNKGEYEQKYRNFRFSSPKTATDMGVSSPESHDLILFYETVTAGFRVLSKSTGFYPPSDRIVEINAQTLESGTWRQVLQWINIPPTMCKEPVVAELDKEFLDLKETTGFKGQASPDLDWTRFVPQHDRVS